MQRFGFIYRSHLISVVLCTTAFVFAASLVQADQSSDVLKAAASDGVTGGLCVLFGAEKTDLAAELAATGRFLVQVLDNENQVIDQARRRLRLKGLYGLVSVERLPKLGGLPLTENLVNLLVVWPQDSARVSAGEAARVLCPNGMLMVGGGMTAEQLEAVGMVDVRKIGGAAGWLMARKPRPAKMDEWSHPLHSAAANTASQDALVAPPRRLRWVAGATAEVPGMVTTAGRNFYSGRRDDIPAVADTNERKFYVGVLARDGFNGLRLWNRDLVGRDSGGFTPNNPPPLVADGDRLYAIQMQSLGQKKLLALDAATGKTIREYPDAEAPGTVLFCAGTLIAVTKDSVRALDAESANLKWTFAASNPRYVVAGDDMVALIQGRGKRGEPVEAVVLDMTNGKVRWQSDDFPWLPKVTRTVYHRGFVTFEASTLNNDRPGNAIHIGA